MPNASRKNGSKPRYSQVQYVNRNMRPLKRTIKRGREQQLSSDEGSQEAMQYGQGGSGDGSSPDQHSNGQEIEDGGS